VCVVGVVGFAPSVEREEKRFKRNGKFEAKLSEMENAGDGTRDLGAKIKVM